GGSVMIGTAPGMFGTGAGRIAPRPGGSVCPGNTCPGSVCGGSVCGGSVCVGGVGCPAGVGLACSSVGSPESISDALDAGTAAVTTLLVSSAGGSGCGK